MTTVIVVDASVLATALADDGGDGDRARERLRGEELCAPELIVLEVASVLRRQVQSRALEPRRAGLALRDLDDLPIALAAHRPLLPRVWDLRENLTPHDASYVALAEATASVLVTADGRLARAPGIRCECDVLTGA
ncbi:type II toxin-antitoxin system VapC family toxin [Microbacterium sp.]|uniref:type II toxin-antitoxin system VapC family toxin n=1 Tax=Microbacterium sp. TaxID=51671 RepID=UPI003C773044